MGTCMEEYFTLPEVTFVGGNTQEFKFHAYFYTDKSPHSLVGCDARFSVVSYLNRGGAAIITKTMTIEEDEEEEEYNILSVTLSASDTVNLSGKYVYQISIRGEDGKYEIPKHGVMNITGNIDKSFVNSSN